MGKLIFQSYCLIEDSKTLPLRGRAPFKWLKRTPAACDATDSYGDVRKNASIRVTLRRCSLAGERDDDNEGSSPEELTEVGMPDYCKPHPLLAHYVESVACTIHRTVHA